MVGPDKRGREKGRILYIFRRGLQGRVLKDLLKWGRHIIPKTETDAPRTRWRAPGDKIKGRGRFPGTKKGRGGPRTRDEPGQGARSKERGTSDRGGAGDKDNG